MQRTGLGVLLQHLREKRGLSLRELGQLSGVDHAYIYRLETGEKEAPSEDVVSKLVRALKAAKRDADMLLYLASHSPTDAELVRHMTRDETIPFEVLAMVSGASFRGNRQDYVKLIARARALLAENDAAE
jgi:HTH-type transcriptional regulator, competence development regulator